MPRSHPEAISPTAHYTGTVWLQHGLSHPAFATLHGQGLYYALKAPMAISSHLGGPSLEDFLLARHRLIDLQLAEAIENGVISQVIEVASGLSPRGWRFTERYKGRIRYLEADLPDMARTKRELLINGGLDREGHEVHDINALADDGPESLAALAATLDRSQGTAIITEGLINYFDTDTVTGMWARFARVLSGFPRGLYLSDLHLKATNKGMLIDAFMRGLSTFVRGRVHLHYDSADVALQALQESGFHHAALLRPSDFGHRLPDCRRHAADLVRVVSARTHY